jgi:hypothetical protein
MTVAKVPTALARSDTRWGVENQRGMSPRSMMCDTVMLKPISGALRVNDAERIVEIA